MSEEFCNQGRGRKQRDHDGGIEEDDVDCERLGGAVVLIDRKSGETEIGNEFRSMEPVRAQTSRYLSDDCVRTMPSPVMKHEAPFLYAKAVKQTWIMAEASDAMTKCIAILRGPFPRTQLRGRSLSMA